MFIDIETSHFVFVKCPLYTADMQTAQRYIQTS